MGAADGLQYGKPSDERFVERGGRGDGGQRRLHLCASSFSDHKRDDNKDLGRHHALDAYAAVTRMTEPEYERARRIDAKQSTDANVQRARAIVREDFASERGMGILRLREHCLFRPDFQFEPFRQVLSEIFSGGAE